MNCKVGDKVEVQYAHYNFIGTIRLTLEQAKKIIGLEEAGSQFLIETDSSVAWPYSMWGSAIEQAGYDIDKTKKYLWLRSIRFTRLISRSSGRIPKKYT